MPAVSASGCTRLASRSTSSRSRPTSFRSTSAPSGFRIGDALERLLGEGVRLTPTMRPGVLRAVTHLAITDEDIDVASEAIPRALGVAARV